jgi:hypothetical protein
MRYTASVSEFFKSPKWGTNLLLGALCIFIPFLGPIVLQGWHVTGFWSRGNDDDPARFPPFDFQNFGKYLERGIWPFLVNLILSFVMIPILILIIGIFLILLIPGISHSGNEIPVSLAMGFFIGFPIIYIALVLCFQMLAIPLTLRASMTQDFAKSFNLGFAKSFLKLVSKELFLCMLFIFGVGIGLVILTIITCYIGGILLAPVTMYAWHHLQKQLYGLYLSRGGTPIPVSFKLTDNPPALPTA